MSDATWSKPGTDEAAKGVGIDRIRAIWDRRKWLAIVTFLLPMAAATGLVMSLPKVYKSTAVVLVERQQVPEEFVRPTVTSEIETRLQTITQEILSRSRLEELVKRFNLYPDLRQRVSNEEIVDRMRSAINLQLRASEQRGRGTTVAFALSFQGSDPRTVALVTNTLASFYIEENLKVRERQAAGTASFLKVQLEEAKRRLDAQERNVSAFRTRFMGELPQQMQANLTALETLQTQLRLNNDNQLRASERLQTLQAQLAEAATLTQMAPASVGGPAPVESGAVRVARLKQELTAARTRYTEAHPTIIRLKSELEAVEREVDASRVEAGDAASGPSSTPPNPYAMRLREAIQSVESELKLLKVEDQRLRSASAIYRTRVDNTPRREQEFLDLSRDYETTKAHYQSLSARHEEAQLAESMEQRQKGEQFRVVDPAIPSAMPAAPNRPRLLLLGLALAAGLAGGAVMLAELLDTSFHSVAELRALGLVPVLVSIPWIQTEANARRRRRRFRLAAAGLVVAIVAVTGASYAVGHGNERLTSLVSRGAA